MISLSMQPFQQRGVALVVGLIMLLILTVLAIAGMNSASLEFIMAGNEQYTTNAFQAAETGIAQAVAVCQIACTTTASAMPSATGTAINATDTYGYSIATPVQTPYTPPGFSFNSYAAYDFVITANGSSARSAQAVHQQGYRFISKN